MSPIAGGKICNKPYLHTFLQCINCTLMDTSIIPDPFQSRDISQPRIPVGPRERIVRLTKLSRQGERFAPESIPLQVGVQSQGSDKI